MSGHRLTPIDVADFVRCWNEGMMTARMCVRFERVRTTLYERAMRLRRLGFALCMRDSQGRALANTPSTRVVCAWCLNQCACVDVTIVDVRYQCRECATALTFIDDCTTGSVK